MCHHDLAQHMDDVRHRLPTARQQARPPDPSFLIRIVAFFAVVRALRPFCFLSVLGSRSLSPKSSPSWQVGGPYEDCRGGDVR